MSDKTGKLFIANLSSKVRTSDLEEFLERYGKILSITIKDGRDRFAFVEFENWKDAEEVIRKKNNTELLGRELRIEFSHGERRRRDNSVQKKSTHCLVCNEKGHWAKDCSKGDGLAVRDGKCFICGGRGHKKKDCPEGSPKRRGRSRSRSRSRNRSRGGNRGERRGSPRYSRSRSRSRGRNRDHERRRSDSRDRRRRKSRSSSPRKNSRSKSRRRKADRNDSDIPRDSLSPLRKS